jgi:hypothetical protein
VAPCAVCTMHIEMRSTGFLVRPQNQGRWFVSGLTQNHWDSFSSVWASKPMAMVCEWFGLKTTRTVFVGLASKPVATVCEWFDLKTTWMVFTGLPSKSVATVSSGLALKPTMSVFFDLASKSVATVFAGLTSKPVVTVSGGLALNLL